MLATSIKTISLLILFNLSIVGVAQVIGRGLHSGVLFFTSSRDQGYYKLFALDVEYGTIRKISDQRIQFGFALSPNGKFIVTVHQDEQDTRPALIVMDWNGRDAQFVTQPFEHRIGNRFLWSPDSRLIAFTTEEPNRSVIHLVDLESNSSRVLDGQETFKSLTGWADDGELLFYSDRTRQQSWQVNVQTGSVRPDERPRRRDDVALSPDGLYMVTVSKQDSKRELVIVNPGDSSRWQLTENGLNEFHPAWSLNGDRIAFVASSEQSETGNASLYVIDLHGNTQRLTHDFYSYWSPTWWSMLNFWD